MISRVPFTTELSTKYPKWVHFLLSHAQKFLHAEKKNVEMQAISSTLASLEYTMHFTSENITVL